MTAIKRLPPALGDVPFEGDLLSRAPLAKRLTEFVDRLREGHVIGIHAPWGEGKTWFGLNWADQLKSAGYQTIWLDAFEVDHTEDPFIALSSPIASLARQQAGDKGAEFIEKTKALGRKLAPFILKTTLRAAGKAALGIDGMKEAKEILEGTPEDIDEAAERWIEKRLQDAEKEKETIKAFQLALTNLAADQQKPLVFFIDELDRCRPDYAVRLIELVKHLFDVPNVVFVLLLNRTQLEAAIQGLYGEKIDASDYLSKFVRFFLNLPKAAHDYTGQSQQITKFCRKLANEFGLNGATDDFIFTLSVLGSQLGLSLRDYERSMTLYALSGIQQTSLVAGWIVALKVRKPDLFYRLMRNEKEAHQECVKFLASVSGRIENNELVQAFIALHQATIAGKTDEATRDALEPIRHSLGSSGKPIKFICDRVDLPISQ